MNKQTILIALCFALTLRCNLVSEVTSTIAFENLPNDSVLDCISNEHSNIKDIKTFCGDISSKSMGCYSFYSSIQLCLLNNKCDINTDNHIVAN
jgi:hypothetical protein